MSKTISNWHDLREFGIECLTGEACGINLRLLCDLTNRGLEILQKALSVKHIDLFPQWNNGPNKVGSIMLSQDFFGTIVIFALLEGGYPEVWQCKNGNYIGITRDDIVKHNQEIDFWKECSGFEKRWAYKGTAGDRNIHMMSGRTE